MKKILFAFTMLLVIAACTNTGVPRQSGDGLAQGAEGEITGLDFNIKK